MNDEEKIEFYIAICKCCLLSQAMRNCPLCRFNIGLAGQIATVDLQPPIDSKAAIIAISV
jgi:hypothetical protein